MKKGKHLSRERDSNGGAIKTYIKDQFILSYSQIIVMEKETQRNPQFDTQINDAGMPQMREIVGHPIHI